MATMELFIDPSIRCPGPEAVRADATIITGVTHNNHPCRIVDNTGLVSRQDLEEVLRALIAERRFGIAALSAHGSGVLSIGHPDSTHIQFGDRLYRLLLFPYEARIENF